MAYIISDDVLKDQVCTACKKYLSCPPIKTYRSGEIKCGRCSRPDDGGAISVFETLAKSMVFPCVNRFEGCTKLLHYMDVKEHEKNCVGIVVECPLCPNDKFPLLFLIHHFEVQHDKNIMKYSVVDLNSLDHEFVEYFLKYDFNTNDIFMIKIGWDTRKLSINCATITDNKSGIKAPKVQVSFFSIDEGELNLYSTDVKDCLDLKYYLLDPSQDVFTYSVPLQLTQIRCKFIFNCNLKISKIEPFLLNNIIKFERKMLPNMYLDSEFKEKYKSLDLSKFKISSCGQKMINNNYSLYIGCDFCYNFFASSGFIKDIYYNTYGYICGTCYSRGITKSLNNDGSELKKLGDVGYHLINFYCKFGCKKFFRSGELLSHEDQCVVNPQRLLCEEDYVKWRFGDEFVKGSKVSRENVIMFVPNKFKDTGKIFVATRDSFKCIIDYKQDSKAKLCVFHINHKYDTRKYYILVNRWENKTFSTSYNDFSMKTENCDGPSMFAIRVKEIVEDLEIFYARFYDT